MLAEVAEAVEDIDRDMIATRISEMESRIEKMQPGNALDKLIMRLDHFKAVDRHLTGTAAALSGASHCAFTLANCENSFTTRS